MRKAWEHLSHDVYSSEHRVDMGKGGCPTTNLCAMNLNASFFPFKLSNLDLVNVLGPALEDED